MRAKRVSDKVEAEMVLANRLSACDAVTRLDLGEHKEAWALAHGLHDIEEASKVIAERLLPALNRSEITDEEIEELLQDIGEELRQILYQVSHLRYYDYLVEQPSGKEA